MFCSGLLFWLERCAAILRFRYSFACTALILPLVLILANERSMLAFPLVAGIRIHNAKNIDIAGNHLDGLFNHVISLKERVASALIVDNTFDACGRTCIEAGQEPTTD